MLHGITWGNGLDLQLWRLTAHRKEILFHQEGEAALEQRALFINVFKAWLNIAVVELIPFGNRCASSGKRIRGSPDACYREDFVILWHSTNTP